MSIDDIIDLDAALKVQFPQGHVESMPLFTERIEDVVLTVIRITIDGGSCRHQLYAITEYGWALTAIFGNYADAMSEVLKWRRYLDRGGTVAAWQLDHSDGIYPERSGF